MRLKAASNNAEPHNSEGTFIGWYPFIYDYAEEFDETEPSPQFLHMDGRTPHERPCGIHDYLPIAHGVHPTRYTAMHGSRLCVQVEIWMGCWSHVLFDNNAIGEFSWIRRLFSIGEVLF